jgi:hypothetical protein
VRYDTHTHIHIYIYIYIYIYVIRRLKVKKARDTQIALKPLMYSIHIKTYELEHLSMFCPNTTSHSQVPISLQKQIHACDNETH